MSMFQNSEYKPVEVTADLAVASSAAKIGSITVNGVGTATSIDVYNGVDATGTKIASIASGALAQAQIYPYFCEMANGIFIDFGGGGVSISLTVTFKESDN